MIGHLLNLILEWMEMETSVCSLPPLQVSYVYRSLPVKTLKYQQINISLVLFSNKFDIQNCLIDKFSFETNKHYNYISFIRRALFCE